MEKGSKIYIAGHNGLVGSAILRRLKQEGYSNLLYRSHKELNLTDRFEVETFFKEEKPEYVFLAAAKVGGILANNTYPAEFIYSNLTIQTNIIHNSYKNKVKKLLFLGSSCIYPKECPQPMKETDLLSGYLEQTNESYAIAKIAGIKMCQAYNRQYGTCFINLMPTNLYGPNDNFNLETSHVLPALIQKIHTAKITGRSEVEIWGSGTPRREFLYVDDLALACLFLMNNYESSEIINIGTGKDCTIRELSELISKVIGFNGKFRFDMTKPDGTLLKKLDVSKINNLGWEAPTDLESGLKKTYEWFLDNIG